ncbi:unnamed protein product [Sphenostylis stenocarpa]|uniref:Exocyst subunit Exo70 family protein n=1 Tax=Sphenostylis stenocarpa TaxID=92480 RepID=A0AA86TF01_9FABA|nr:unnamed protein product [Sphenostylis stenocarpa]
MERILIKIQSCLQKTKVWRFVCFFSSIVGLLCYALSSSFNHLYGNWTWWKILVYIVFSFIICLAVLFAKAWKCSPQMETHLVFVILMITCIYSFFFDKEVKGKPDAYSLVSCAAFAIMSLALVRLCHFGFEVDLLYFFSGALTLQLMKIKLWLVIVGGSFTYSLIILRSTLFSSKSIYHGIQDRDHVVIEVASQLQSQGTGTRTSPRTGQVDSAQLIVTMAQEADSPPENEDQGLLVGQPQQHNNSDTDVNSLVAKFEGCIETLKKENGNLILTILKHVDEYLKADLITKNHINQLPQLHPDDNLVLDSLPSGIINELGKSIKLMMKAGLEEECLQVYRTSRMGFLNEILSALKELNMEGIDELAKMRHTVKALLIVHRIVLPNERRLYERVFQWFIHRLDLFSTLPGRNKVRFWERIGIEPPMDTVKSSRIEKLLYLSDDNKDQATVPSSRIHQITRDLLNYIQMIYLNLKDLSPIIVDKDEKLSLYLHLAMMADILDTSLEAISKSYNDPTLGYIFIINNRRFIHLTSKRENLKPAFGDDWLRKNTIELQQKLELYLRSSWNKIVDTLKLDINESEPNVATELMKNKLLSFNEHFDDICNVQATWFVLNEELREHIIKSIENILLPAYGNFIARFQDFLGNHAYKYIKHGMFDVQHRLNNLFLVRK